MKVQKIFSWFKDMEDKESRSKINMEVHFMHTS